MVKWIGRLSIHHQAQAEVSLSRTEFLAAPAVCSAFCTGQKRGINLMRISKIAHYYSHPPVPASVTCGESWSSTFQPFLDVKWSGKWKAHGRSCSAGKYLCSREEPVELEGSAEKSSDLLGNLSPVVRFVFLAARGLSGSDWGVESRSETHQINGWMGLLPVKQPKCLALE